MTGQGFFTERDSAEVVVSHSDEIFVIMPKIPTSDRAVGRLS